MVANGPKGKALKRPGLNLGEGIGTRGLGVPVTETWRNSGGIKMRTALAGMVGHYPMSPDRGRWQFSLRALNVVN